MLKDVHASRQQFCLFLTSKYALGGWFLKNNFVEKTLESPLDCKEIQPVHSKGPLRSHPLSSAPSRPGAAPALTLSQRVRLQQTPSRELRGRGGVWKDIAGNPGRGRREEQTEGGKGSRAGVRGVRTETVYRERRGLHQDGRGTGVSPIPVPAPSLPRGWVSPRPGEATAREVVSRRRGVVPVSSPNTPPHPARASFA